MLNPFKEVNWDPGVPEKRKFALSLIIGFPVIALVFSALAWFTKHTWKPFFLWLGIIGFLVGAILWLVPRIARPFYMVWYFLACCMGIVMGNLMLSIFFFLVLTPLGLLLRAAGRKPMTKEFDRKCTTYWKDVKKDIDPGNYYRQF